MLTGDLVRVRHARNRIIPYYISPEEPEWVAAAERLLDLFRLRDGGTRGELEEDLAEAFGEEGGQIVYRGLAKLLEDRCEFEVVSGQPPERVREVVFRAATQFRQEVRTEEPIEGELRPRRGFDREGALRRAAEELGMIPEAVEQSLFADLKSEQRLIQFRDISAEHLLQRYNVALAQSVLLRSARVEVLIRNESPSRYRQLFRLVKFHRLICEAIRTGPGCCRLTLDGPLSLFSATQKYGLQLALFLPVVLLCKDFELTADVRWGPRKQAKIFTLSASDGLVSPLADTGTYVPPELHMFVELFRKRIDTWDIAEEDEVISLGESFWVPDFRLTHRESGQILALEVLGFWRKTSAATHLERLRAHADRPFLLAVSDSLRIEEDELSDLPAGVHRFRQMPLPDEIVRLAEIQRQKQASTEQSS